MLHFSLLAVLYYIIWYYIILCYKIIYFTILCCTASRCTILYYAMLYYTIPYYTTLYYNTFSKSYGPHVRGGLTSMLGMCSRELLGNDLRRAVRDLICDENFDDGIATCLRLDFEILVSLAHALRNSSLLARTKNRAKTYAAAAVLWIIGKRGFYLDPPNPK